MELWQSPEYEDAEREYEQMNRELMEEVTLSVPAISQPMTTSVAPHVSVPPISVPISVNIPQSGGSAVDMEFRETWKRVQALRKPYPGAPNVTSVGKSAGFNLSSSGQATQAKILQFFTMGTSTSLGLPPPEVVVKDGTKTAPNTKPGHKNRPGLYYSDF